MGSSKGGAFGWANEALFGDGGAGAAGAAAMAQQAAARAAFREYRDIINPATTQGLAALDKDIANQEKNLARQEQLIAQIDPTIIEASQQALKLLRGEESSTLNPMKQQRSLQRQKLLNSLREQLGPGAETSSAGMQALTQFDSETSSLMSGAQQSALANLGGLATQFTQTRPDMFREIAGLSGLGQAKTGLSFQRAQGLFSARQPMFQTAGAQYTADAIRGQNNAAFGQALIGAAVGGATQGYFGR